MSEEEDDLFDEDFAWNWTASEPTELEEEEARILLEHAPLCGADRVFLEESLENIGVEDWDSEEFQGIKNAHIHVIHQHQR